MPMLLLAEAGRSLNKDLKSLFRHDLQTPRVLDRLVQELHSDKELCSYLFLNHPGSEDMLWGLMNLLTEDSRIAGNASYVIGTLAEMDLGKKRIVSICTDKGEQAKKILPALTAMLDMADTETVMNAAGTIGTLAEDNDCRLWMLREECLDQAISRLTELLSCKDMCTASNAALVLARLTIAEEGCARILNHRKSSRTLVQLCKALGADETGRGMNAAFAIGRLCDFEAGCKRMLSLKESNRMIDSLVDMLHSGDSGCCKNACFALSCIASIALGHQRLLEHCKIDSVVQVLCHFLQSNDDENIWFASMMLHTLACQKSGCLYLRKQPNLQSSLEELLQRTNLKKDTKEEVELTLAILEKLPKPEPPTVKVESAWSAIVNWIAIHPPSKLDVTYELFQDGESVYCGPRASYIANDLKPITKYNFTLQATTEGDDSPTSNPAVIVTPESVPSAPQCLRVQTKTTSQIKITWEPPAMSNGVLKGYQVVVRGKTSCLDASENCFILSSLPPDTEYTFQVFALTSQGRGEPAVITTATDDLASHAPPKPVVQVLGRHELMIQWESPPRPLGRINSFEVRVDGTVIYNGVEKCCTAKSLKPNMEYTITVSAWCSEGRCESVPAKKRTAREVYNPLYKVNGPSKQGNARSTTKKSGASVAAAATAAVTACTATKTGTKAKPKAPTRKPLYPYDSKSTPSKQERVLKRARTADVLRVPTADNFHSETKETRVKKSGLAAESKVRPRTSYGEENGSKHENSTVNGPQNPALNKPLGKRSAKHNPVSPSLSLESLDKDHDYSKEASETVSESSSLSSHGSETRDRRAVSDTAPIDSHKRLTKRHSQLGSNASSAKDKTGKGSSVRRSSLPVSGTPHHKSAKSSAGRPPPLITVGNESPDPSQGVRTVTEGVASLRVGKTSTDYKKPPKPAKKSQFANSFDELKQVHRVGARGTNTSRNGLPTTPPSRRDEEKRPSVGSHETT